MRRATQRLAESQQQGAISIHALLAESDTHQVGVRDGEPDFYPRSPCGERRKPLKAWTWPTYFYPRSPCGERPIMLLVRLTPSNFYPRSPCGERPHSAPSPQAVSVFLSTLSLRRATLGIGKSAVSKLISIHALLADSDVLEYVIRIYKILFLSTLSLRRATCIFGLGAANWTYFYPRSPCGERL